MHLCEAKKYEDMAQLFDQIFHATIESLRVGTFIAIAKKIQNNRDPVAAKFVKGFLLDWAVKFYENKRLNQLLKVELFGMALQCFARSKHKLAGEMVEEYLDKLEQIVDEEVLPITKNVHLYSAAMNSYAARGSWKQGLKPSLIAARPPLRPEMKKHGLMQYFGIH